MFLSLRCFLIGSLLSSSAYAVPNFIVRPDFRNRHAPNVDPLKTGTLFLNGGIANGTNNAIPNSGGVFLREYSFGHPALPYTSPHNSFANDVLRLGRLLPNGTTIPPVLPALYPAGYGTPGGITLNRTQIQNANGTDGPRVAFRYKWLLYGQDPDPVGGGPPPIINVFEQSLGSANWFTDADRAVVEAQRAALIEALAIDPTNVELQNTLLDLAYDYSVAEMITNRKFLTDIAKKRLGLTTISTFIIDEEIEAYESLALNAERSITSYTSLFSNREDGVDTLDLDPLAGRASLGYYLFRKLVPFRSQAPMQFAPTGNAAVTDVLAPTTENTFTGYKDYRNLLTVLGQFIQYQSDLARLLALRGNQGDLTEAQTILTKVQSFANSYGSLSNIFSGTNFDDGTLDASGVRAAMTLTKTAINDALATNAYVNGTSNPLGLDPNFLLLLPTEPQNNLFDTFDIMMARLTATSNGLPTGPLAVALSRLGDPTKPTSGGGAVQAFTLFRQSVDTVVTELSGLEDDYALRYEQITGYKVDEQPNFDGIRAKPNTGSELATVERNIDSLITSLEILGEITNQLLEDISKANVAVTLAEGIDDAITAAQSAYEEETASAWIEIHAWAGIAAGAAATTDAVYAAAGVDGVSTFFSGGSNEVAIGVAGALNIATQTAAAARTSQRTQEIEKAALTLDTKLATAELPLTVMQAKLEAGALLREAFANRLEIQDTFTALGQAIADKSALLRELERTIENRSASRDQLARKYYADPIHFVRAERAILQADAAFKNAQRWVFFTCRALEYKWSERFSMPFTTEETYDIGTIFKARNAAELSTIVQQMTLWNGNRTGSPQPNTTIISLRDKLVTPNPIDVNLDFAPTLVDKGLRFNEQTGAIVDKTVRFRQILQNYTDASGNIVIPFNTFLLAGLGGTFFAGPDFSDAQNPEQGAYRDKIDSIAVNLVASDGVTPPDLNGRSGRITYSGTTFFRTRVPLYRNRNVARTLADADKFNIEKDFPGEFIYAPFRFFQDTNFTGVFETFNVQNVGSMRFAYSRDSANNQTVLNRLIDPASGFLRKDLKERSVAATRWGLRINAGQINLANLQDIEIVVKHISYARPQIRPQP
jgi:hypothetical protein